MMNDDTAGSWRGFFAPATVANVGPGYDCFGLALTGAGDTVWARLSHTHQGVQLIAVEGDGGALPTETARNTAGRAAESAWERLQIHDVGLDLRLIKGLPLCSGLGSSAASAVAGAFAAVTLGRELLDPEPQQELAADKELLLEAALDGEALASGQRHADNVAPALFGGFTLVYRQDPPAVQRFTPALDLWISAVTPDLEIPTRAARAMLPKLIPLDAASRQWANSAAMVAALLQGDKALLQASLVDEIVEPLRAKLIPGFAQARQAALQAGAIAFSISGAGPTVFALCDDDEVAQSCGPLIAEVFSREGLSAKFRHSPIAQQGAHAL